MTMESNDNIDTKSHLLDIEARLDRLTKHQSFFNNLSAAHRDDEIDLLEIWNALWNGKWWITGITFLFALGSVIFVLSLPNRYKAEIVLAPAQEQNGGLGGLIGQYGGLAAMAGINLGGRQSSDVDQAIVLVKSWPFLDAFVDKYNLKAQIMAIKAWDSINDRILYDNDIYSAETREWLREPKPNRPAEPTSYEVYRKLSKMVNVSRDAKSGLINLSVEHFVPKLTHDWVALLARELNNHFQQRDIQDATRNIDYLRGKIQETSIAEMQLVFYRMVEAQMKTLMLAEVSSEYLLKTVVKSEMPEVKSGPSRVLICFMGVILGGVFSVTIVIVLHFFHKNRQRQV